MQEAHERITRHGAGRPHRYTSVAAVACLLLVAACSSGDDDDGDAPPLGTDETGVTTAPSPPEQTPADDAPGTVLPPVAEGPAADAPDTDAPETDGPGTDEPGAADSPTADATPPPTDPTPPADMPTPPVATPPPGTTPPPDPTADGSMATALEGNWLLECSEIVQGQPDDGFQVIALTIAGDSVTSSAFGYEDSDCQIPGIPAELTRTFSIAFPGGVTDTARGAASHLDITIVDALVDGEPQPTDGSTLHDIVLVESDALYTGNLTADPALDGRSPDARPVELLATPYRRQ